MSTVSLKRRLSTPYIPELSKRYHHIPYVSIIPTKFAVSGKKRKLEDIEECSALIKRLNIKESHIYLALSEIDKPAIIKHQIYIAPDLVMAYCHSGDPRNYFATDIQRLFRGWSTRKRLNNIHTNFKNEILYAV
jgi:hypothetical protein